MQFAVMLAICRHAVRVMFLCRFLLVFELCCQVTSLRWGAAKLQGLLSHKEAACIWRPLILLLTLISL
jgi:uncharacterized metal-binding protein